MTREKRYKDIGIVIILFLLVCVPSTILFFADGGQIKGFNEDQNNPGNALNTDIGGYVFVPVEEEIIPIYDDKEIVQTELWQMPINVFSAVFSLRSPAGISRIGYPVMGREEYIIHVDKLPL